jgi:hypothetical protein
MIENTFMPMFVERKVRYSALFTKLVGWHAGAVSFPLTDIILAQLSCPCFVYILEELTYLSTNIALCTKTLDQCL